MDNIDKHILIEDDDTGIDLNDIMFQENVLYA